MDNGADGESIEMKSVGIGLLTVAFLCPWVPCFLRGGLLGEAHAALGPVDAFASALPIGCLASALLALLAFGLRPFRSFLGRHVLRAAAVAYVLGYTVLLIALMDRSDLTASFGGAAAGLGVVPLGLWWCAQTKATEFSRILFAGALIGLGVFAASRLIGMLPGEGGAVAWLLCAVVAGGWAWRGNRDGGCEGSASHVGDGRASVAEGLSALLSARSAFSVIATAAIGLVPFVLLGNILPGVTVGDFTFDSSTGLLVGSLLTLVIAAFARREKPIAPTLFWTVFPVCAGVLMVLLAFPKETFASTLSAGLAFAFFSMIGVFAVVCCAHVVAQREFPPALVVAPPFALAAAASVAANLLSGIETTSEEAGAALMVVAMAYFVFLMLAPAFQLRRLRETMVSEGETEGTDGAARLAFDEACEMLAARRALSKREREVFGYLVKGYTSPYIAKALFISDSTVRSHTKSIYRKFEVSSRTDLIEVVRAFAEEGEEV